MKKKFWSVYLLSLAQLLAYLILSGCHASDKPTVGSPSRPRAVAPKVSFALQDTPRLVRQHVSHALKTLSFATHIARPDDCGGGWDVHYISMQDWPEKHAFVAMRLYSKEDIVQFVGMELQWRHPLYPSPEGEYFDPVQKSWSETCEKQEYVKPHEKRHSFVGWDCDGVVIRQTRGNHSMDETRTPLGLEHLKDQASLQKAIDVVATPISTLRTLSITEYDAGLFLLFEPRGLASWFHHLHGAEKDHALFCLRKVGAPTTFIF